MGKRHRYERGCAPHAGAGAGPHAAKPRATVKIPNAETSDRWEMAFMNPSFSTPMLPLPR